MISTPIFLIGTKYILSTQVLKCTSTQVHKYTSTSHNRSPGGCKRLSDSPGFGDARSDAMRCDTSDSSLVFFFFFFLSFLSYADTPVHVNAIVPGLSLILFYFSLFLSLLSLPPTFILQVVHLKIDRGGCHPGPVNFPPQRQPAHANAL